MRVFLDANVLFSAAYRPLAGLTRIWSHPGLTLVTSPYAIEEARRNLDSPDKQDRLDSLLKQVEQLPPPTISIPEAARSLPVKDQPILRDALHARCDVLLTGDLTHFGHWYDRRLSGILVLPPARLLNQLDGLASDPTSPKNQT